MSLDINLTGVEKTSNKKTTLTDNSDTFYPTQKAVKTAVDSKFNTPTGTTAQYLRGDGTTATFPTIPSITGLVPYTGATADVDLGDNDLNAEGIKIKGTGGNGHLNLKHQSSGASAGGSESVIYADNSGNPKWKNDGNAVQNVMLENSPITGATKTKITYDAKGLVTSGADATTADIADSTNKRYVTDANLVVIGNTSGTNTGDETQSSILSKLGWWRIHETTAGSNSSGTSNTISKSIEIGAITDVLNIDKVTFTKTGTAGTFTARIYLSEVDNNIGGTAILLGTALTTNANNLYLAFERLHEKIGSNICGINASSSANSDRIQSGSARLNTAILTGSPLYLIFTTQCTNSADVARFESAYIKNF
jgi:hypothetical protein